MNCRKTAFVVVFVLLALPGFSQSVLLEGIARSGAKALTEQTSAALANKIARSVVPAVSERLVALPAFSLTSFNANTLDFTNINNGRGYAFIKYHTDFLKNLGSAVTFEGFFLPTVEALKKELVSPMVHPTHASQALYDAAHDAIKMPSGFFGVKVVKDGIADVLVLDINKGEWQSLQKFLGGVQLPAEPLTK